MRGSIASGGRVPEPKEGGVAVADPKKPGAGAISLLVRATIKGYGGNTDPAYQLLQEEVERDRRSPLV